MNVQRLSSSTTPEFDAITRIYEECLPASERKSLAALAQMISRPEYHFLAAVDSGLVMGFSIALALQGTDAGLLEYMAIAPAHRGCGLGQRLFLATAAHASLAGRYLLVEVDSDRLPGTDHAASTRRKAFYRRVGCREIEGLTYRMPQVSESLPPPMEMLLCFEPMPESIPKTTVRAWLEACYTQVYGVSAGDSRIGAMVESLARDVRLI